MGKKQRGSKLEQPASSGASSRMPTLLGVGLGGAAVIGAAFSTMLTSRRPLLPSSPVPIVVWRREDAIADFSRKASKAYSAHSSPVQFKGVLSDSQQSPWGGPALWAPPRLHLEALIAAASPTARPKVSAESFFQFFSTPKQDEWREKWKLTPPSTTFRWDLDSPADVLRELLAGRRGASWSSGVGGSSGGGSAERVETHGYWILKTNEVSAHKGSQPHLLLQLPLRSSLL